MDLLLKQKCKEKIFEQTTSAWGRGTEAKNNSNHVIKYFPRKTTEVGRGWGERRTLTNNQRVRGGDRGEKQN